MSEFLTYIREHEKAMKLSFDALDHNKDGYIDVDELMRHLKKIGIRVSREEALNMIQRSIQCNTSNFIKIATYCQNNYQRFSNCDI